MRKWIVFLLGFLAGCILTALVFIIIENGTNTTKKVEDTENTEESDEILDSLARDKEMEAEVIKQPKTNKITYPGLELFDEPGEEFSATSFRVSQVLSNNIALAYSGEEIYPGETMYLGTNVLLIGNDNTYFYDDQIVEVASNKKARLIGIFKDRHRTIPAIKIFNEK